MLLRVDPDRFAGLDRGWRFAGLAGGNLLGLGLLAWLVGLGFLGRNRFLLANQERT